MELHLLIETDEGGDEGCVVVGGQQWRLSDPYPADEKDHLPPYACVSYVWGEGRLENPLFPGRFMSDQTLPALEAVIRASSPEVSAFWIDAFCVPYDQPARSATLESMGSIYSAAERVVAALGPEYLEAMQKMMEQEWLSEDLLAAFESNAWISSVWTYQEVVNAQKYMVTSMAAQAPVIAGDTFLDRVGYSMHKYKQSRNLNSFDMRNIWPHLDAMEDLGGDYMIYSAFQRPILQIMFMLDRRVAYEERNKYYAMLGALTAKRTARRDAAGEGLTSLRSKVMSICEEKGDWSFLYSSTVRDETQPWMPSAEHDLRSILPFFMQGSGQSGRRENEGNVWLEKVVVLGNVLAQEDEADVNTQVRTWKLRSFGVLTFDCYFCSYSSLWPRLLCSGAVVA